jgi:hypothetical protein
MYRYLRIKFSRHLSTSNQKGRQYRGAEIETTIGGKNRKEKTPEHHAIKETHKVQCIEIKRGGHTKNFLR